MLSLNSHASPTGKYKNPVLLMGAGQRGVCPRRALQWVQVPSPLLTCYVIWHGLIDLSVPQFPHL